MGKLYSYPHTCIRSTFDFHQVQANISKFGGSGKRVTVFGESAGALLVTSLLCTGKYLFQRAIMQSAAPGTMAIFFSLFLSWCSITNSKFWTAIAFTRVTSLLSWLRSSIKLRFITCSKFERASGWITNYIVSRVITNSQGVLQMGWNQSHTWNREECNLEREDNW